MADILGGTAAGEYLSNKDFSYDAFLRLEFLGLIVVIAPTSGA